MRGASYTRPDVRGPLIACCTAVLAVACPRLASEDRAVAALVGSDQPQYGLESRTKTHEKELQLASEQDFYLVVDPLESRLRLMLAGVELASYRILEAEAGTPRIGFVSLGFPQWNEPRIWENGRLAPDRSREPHEVVVDSSAGKQDAVPPPPFLPPEIDEPVPDGYCVVYDRLVLDIVSRGQGASRIGHWGPRLREAGQDWVSALRRRSGRLRLVLVAEDAAALYRCLPPGARLLTPALAPAGRQNNLLH
jgi:hypothetical protein